MSLGAKRILGEIHHMDRILRVAITSGLLASALLAVFSFSLPPAHTVEAVTAGTDRYIVVLQAGADPRAVASSHGVTPEHVYQYALKGFSATLPSPSVQGLSRDPRVAYLELDQPVLLFDQEIPNGVQRIFADENPDSTIDGNDDYRVDVDVAVIDTGIDLDHLDLNVVASTNCARGGPLGGGCRDGEGDDGNGHGSHVAGTIAALDNGLGVVGAAPGARLWAVRVLDNAGSGYMSWIIAGVDWVTARATQIEVANMSLGCQCESDALDTAITNSIAAGVVYAVAAGNNDQDAALFSPANHPGVLTVSALADFDGAPGGLASPTCRSDEDDTLANFSNWGSLIEISAPGVCIRSTYKNGGYVTLSGTSMASPHVAGAAALLASGGNAPSNQADMEAIIQTLLREGNLNWTDDSDDDVKEPLLDLSNATVFNPTLVAGSGGGVSNSAPTANNASVATNEDTAVAVIFIGSDAETCDLAFSIITGPSNGSLSAITTNACLGAGPHTASASVTYTPEANFNGSDSFTYKVNDGSANSNTATVSVTVNAVNDAPVAQDKSTSSQKNTLVGITLTASDAETCDLAFSIVTGPSNGSLSAITNNACLGAGPYTASASVTYTPTADFIGSDSFTYKVNDGASDSNTATVSIAVTEQATMHLGDLDGSSTNQGSTWTAVVLITVHDGNHNPVNSANVRGTFTWNGNSVIVLCSTNVSGQCSVQTSGIPKRYSPVTFTVTAVSGTLEYDAANHDPDGDSDGTSISVNKP